MSLPWIDNSTLPVLEQVVAFTQARHGVLAGNIANLNTPGYKSRDLSPEAFQQTLRGALEASREARSPGAAALLGDDRSMGDGLVGLGGDRRVVGGRLDAESLRGVRDSMKSVLYHDESDVGLEQQIAQISKNQSQHNLAIALMQSQFRLLRDAISETIT